jgi:hypothetical protein
VNARTRDGAVSFFFERLDRDDPSGRPGPALRATVASFDASGAQRWRRVLGTVDTHSSPPWPLAVSNAGEIVIAGAFEGVMDVGSPPLSTPAPSWRQPLPYLVRINHQGQVTHARMLSYLRAGPLRGLALAKNGDAVVGIERPRRKQTDPYESSVVRLDSAGRQIWSRDFAGLAGPVQLSDERVALVSYRDTGKQPGSFHELVVLDIDSGKTLTKKSWPLRSYDRALAGSADGGAHLLLYAHEPLPELELGKRDGLSMSLVSFDAELKRVASGTMPMHNGKMLATDRLGRAVVTHMGRFDHGLSFVEGHGANLPGDAAAHYAMAFRPVAAIGDGAHPGQGLELCLDCSEDCRKKGACVARDGKCVVASDAQCRASLACSKDGRCAKGPDGCFAPDAASCDASQACKRRGACTMVNHYCGIPGNEAHCSRSTDCKKRGACALGKRSCMPSKAAHCRDSEECRQSGRCHLLDSYGSRSCTVKSDADCMRSERCRKYGECHLNPQPTGAFCVIAGDADCRHSEACRERGACSLAHAFLGDSLWAHFCEAHTDDDCRRSMACTRDGRCRLVRRQCVK